MTKKIKNWERGRYTGDIPSWFHKITLENIWVDETNGEEGGFDFISDCISGKRHFKTQLEAMCFARRYIKIN